MQTVNGMAELVLMGLLDRPEEVQTFFTELINRDFRGIDCLQGCPECTQFHRLSIIWFYSILDVKLPSDVFKICPPLRMLNASSWDKLYMCYEDYSKQLATYLRLFYEKAQLQSAG